MLLTATDSDMKIAIVLAVLILAGCGSRTPPSAQFDDTNCKAYGAQPGTPEYSNCMQSYENARRRYADNGATGAMVVQEFGRALSAGANAYAKSQADAAAANRTVTCTTYGNTTTCR